jgi:hypothetical protein
VEVCPVATSVPDTCSDPHIEIGVGVLWLFDCHARYEDNFDAVNNLVVISQPTDKGSIDGFGAPEKFLESVSYLFGKQAFAGRVFQAFEGFEVDGLRLLRVLLSVEEHHLSAC